MAETTNTFVDNTDAKEVINDQNDSSNKFAFSYHHRNGNDGADEDGDEQDEEEHSDDLVKNNNDRYIDQQHQDEKKMNPQKSKELPNTKQQIDEFKTQIKKWNRDNYKYVIERLVFINTCLCFTIGFIFVVALSLILFDQNIRITELESRNRHQYTQLEIRMTELESRNRHQYTQLESQNIQIAQLESEISQLESNLELETSDFYSKITRIGNDVAQIERSVWRTIHILQLNDTILARDIDLLSEQDTILARDIDLLSEQYQLLQKNKEFLAKDVYLLSKQLQLTNTSLKQDVYLLLKQLQLTDTSLKKDIQLLQKSKELLAKGVDTLSEQLKKSFENIVNDYYLELDKLKGERIKMRTSCDGIMAKKDTVPFYYWGTKTTLEKDLFQCESIEWELGKNIFHLQHQENIIRFMKKNVVKLN